MAPAGGMPFSILALVLAETARVLSAGQAGTTPRAHLDQWDRRAARRLLLSELQAAALLILSVLIGPAVIGAMAAGIWLAAYLLREP